MAERLIAPVLKTGDGETRSRVQIPAPPLFLHLSKIGLIVDFIKNKSIKSI